MPFSFPEAPSLVKFPPLSPCRSPPHTPRCRASAMRLIRTYVHAHTHTHSHTQQAPLQSFCHVVHTHTHAHTTAKHGCRASARWLLTLDKINFSFFLFSTSFSFKYGPKPGHVCPDTLEVLTHSLMLHTLCPVISAYQPPREEAWLSP